jgi:anti-sigma factor RsiW
MDCNRARDLFSDHLDGALDPSLKGQLHEHLVTCPSCSALRAAFGEVVDTLRTTPELPVPLGLVDRVVEATRRLPRPGFRAPRMPLWMQAAAAALALAVTGLVLLASQPESRTSLVRFKERAVRYGVYVAERKDRAVEELRLLRVVFGTAFEGRVDRVNERVEDYRQLLEKRRASEAETSKDKKMEPAPQGRNFPNSGAPDPVNVSEGAGSGPETTRRSTI